MQLSQCEAKVLVVKLDSIGKKLADCDPLMSHQGKAQALKAPITHGTLYTWTTNMGAVGNQAGLLSIHEPASVLCTTHSPGFNIARHSERRVRRQSQTHCTLIVSPTSLQGILVVHIVRHLSQSWHLFSSPRVDEAHSCGDIYMTGKGG